MQDVETRQRICKLLKKEVVPAIGSVHPMAVALCTARAAELLGVRPQAIRVFLSANILKNAMGVGIPGTGMIGLPIAVALGAVVGKSDYQLEVLKDMTPRALDDARTMVDGGQICINLQPECTEMLYIRVQCEAEGRQTEAIIAGAHTKFVYLHDGNHVLLDKRRGGQGSHDDDDIQLRMQMVYDFATTTPVEELRFILSARDYNMKAAADAIKGNYGHSLGKTMDRPLSRGIFGNSIFSHIIAKTASACDARMGGALIPVMSNSGSGNQGICATNPVAVYAMENENTEEELIRALTLSHLTAVYIKQSLGRLSALCGCVVASIGSSCGITYLMGGDYVRVCHSVKNMIANLTGMICDGAKPSCSLKISSGVSTALLSALLSMEGKCVSAAEGIIDDDVDRCIHNLTSIGADAMRATDAMVLDIMTHKTC